MSDGNFKKYREQLLVQYKLRNKKAVTRHLKSVCDIPRHEDDHAVQTKFRGSVQKGTYVRGLSNVDVLLKMNQSSIKNKPLSKVILYVQDTIEGRLLKTPVSTDKLPVTISYADKTEIQIPPVIRPTDGFRLAKPEGASGATWCTLNVLLRDSSNWQRILLGRNRYVRSLAALASAIANCLTRWILQRESRDSRYKLFGPKRHHPIVNERWA